MMRLVGVVVVSLFLTLAPIGKAQAADSYLSDAGYGFAAVLANLVYMPAKVLYGLGGSVVGGLAYGLTVGNLDAAQYVWSPSLGGTWVLSPEMMAGEKPILFSGESYEPSTKSAGGA